MRGVQEQGQKSHENQESLVQENDPWYIYLLVLHQSASYVMLPENRNMYLLSRHQLVKSCIYMVDLGHAAIVDR